ncbi:hypothetical protein Asi03nite_00250 [Actinoplanes siamensis]|uniref:Uncharacterized protein n=1 Tax=Actinoplanes siamensis TaxID=1223317 RepID=A0A919MWH2_9ACTN|nr:hypothetical protein Asi03nite_00250 [Actinoplanes siamensis]
MNCTFGFRPAASASRIPLNSSVVNPRASTPAAAIVPTFVRLYEWASFYQHPPTTTRTPRRTAPPRPNKIIARPRVDGGEGLRAPRANTVNGRPAARHPHETNADRTGATTASVPIVACPRCGRRAQRGLKSQRGRKSP